MVRPTFMPLSYNYQKLLLLSSPAISIALRSKFTTRPKYKRIVNKTTNLTPLTIVCIQITKLVIINV